MFYGVKVGIIFILDLSHVIFHLPTGREQQQDQTHSEADRTTEDQSPRHTFAYKDRGKEKNSSPVVNKSFLVL